MDFPVCYDVFLYVIWIILPVVVDSRDVFKGLRPALQAFDVTVRDGACEQEVKYRGTWAEVLGVLFAEASVYLQ